VNDDEFMMLAVEEGRQAALDGEVPIGAVLAANDGSILAKAHNQTIALCDPTAHAEILAIRRAAKEIGNYRLLNTTLYVTIEPCAMCMGALLQARVARLVFGACDPKGGAAGSCFDLHADPRLNHAIDIEKGIRERECKDLIQSFFKAKR
jgi:tRNA(adenine34) deaminase